MSDVSSEIHKIHYYRSIKGKRVPYCLTLDANRNFIHDGETEEVKGKQPSHFVEQLKQEPENTPREHSAQLDYLKRSGASYTVGEDGGVVIHAVSPEMTQQLRLFNKHTPCWFPGCEELRERYFEEIKALHDQPGCNIHCAQAKIMRKYITKASEYPGFLS